MVRSITLLLSVALLAVGCNAETKCTEGSEFEPSLCPSAYAEVSAVKITENSKKLALDKTSDANCADFILTEQLVRKYFALAKMTNENDAHHTLDWSPCMSRGEIIFADGQKGIWEINQTRLGRLALHGNKKIVLYCPQCTFSPFQ